MKLLTGSYFRHFLFQIHGVFNVGFKLWHAGRICYELGFPQLPLNSYDQKIEGIFLIISNRGKRDL